MFLCTLLLSAVVATATPAPTAANPAQLQFWVGEWDVLDNGRKVATTSIQSINDGRAILENYAEPGYSGKSLTFVDGVLGKWRQVWVDTQGRVGEFAGEFKDGALHFTGETHTPDGRTIARRLTLEPTADGGVHHYSEKSDDGGKTWVKAYDYIYAKRQ
ncbi:MAG TPA: hypothetical protein VFH88_02970 [Candidatus Krumholzibacteria bacterium]|nr:hypothetical protein [Candidatus Krumholzibacteria bacterium]